MTTNPLIFNPKRVHQHRLRAASTFAQSDFLYREGAQRLVDRIADIKRVFPAALDLAAYCGLLAPYIQGVNGITQVTSHAVGEEFLPFPPESFDIVCSPFSLHWINDLPGILIQINRLLKPGGLFTAMLPGGETLKELRASFEQAELAQMGGISPHISPFVDTRDAAGLLQRAGFSMPVADSELINIHYEHPMKLLEDLRNTGETNALITSSKTFMRRSVFHGAMEYYQQHFSNESKRVNATFEIVTMTGWKADG